MSEPEVCSQCRFDARDYTINDSAGTLRSLATRWRWLAEGVPAATLAARPRADVWSVIEYAAHSRDVTGLLGAALQHMAEHDRPDFGSAPPITPPDTRGGFDGVVDGLAAHADRLQRAATGYADSVWAREATFDGGTYDAAWVLGHACHDATHHLSDAGRVLHWLGAGAVPVTGTVSGLHTSDGGVPKLPVEAAEVTRRGLAGDRQANRYHQASRPRVIPLLRVGQGRT
jgi:hypothetical protein